MGWVKDFHVLSEDVKKEKDAIKKMAAHFRMTCQEFREALQKEINEASRRKFETQHCPFDFYLFHQASIDSERIMSDLPLIKDYHAHHIENCKKCTYLIWCAENSR